MKRAKVWFCAECGYVFPTRPLHTWPPWLRGLGLVACRHVARLPLPPWVRPSLWRLWIRLLRSNGGPHVPHTSPSYHGHPLTPWRP